MTIALDRDVESVRPFIEVANPTHPSLIDTTFSFAAAYDVVNVPTSIWVDEEGRIARPHDTIYVTDTFKDVHRIDPEPLKDAIRRWAREGVVDVDDAGHEPPSPEHSEARAEFAVGRYLAQARDDREAAEPHFTRAVELAPHDWTIRRGSLPMRGIDPMGEVWLRDVGEWVGAGNRYYERIRPKRT